jgi:hypothetical protein
VTKINENKERTIYKRNGGLVARRKQKPKSASEKWDESVTKKAKKFDRDVLGI